MSAAIKAIEHEKLFTTDIEVWRLHYAETLKHWHDRFMTNTDKAREIIYRVQDMLRDQFNPDQPA